MIDIFVLFLGKFECHFFVDNILLFSGFDPFSESSKGLADLVLEEKTQPKEPAAPPAAAHRRLPAFPNAAHSNAATQQRLQDLFAAARQQPQQQSTLSYPEHTSTQSAQPAQQHQRLFERVQNRPPGLESDWNSTEATPPLLQSIFSAYQNNGLSQQQQQQQRALFERLQNRPPGLESESTPPSLQSFFSAYQANGLQQQPQQQHQQQTQQQPQEQQHQQRAFERLQNRPPGLESDWNSTEATPPLLQSIFSTYQNNGLQQQHQQAQQQTQQQSHQPPQQQQGVYNAAMHEYLYRQHCLFREQSAAAIMHIANQMNGQSRPFTNHTPIPPVPSLEAHEQQQQQQLPANLPAALARLYGQQQQNPNFGY